MGASALGRHNPECWSFWWTHGLPSGSNSLLSVAVPGGATHTPAAEHLPCAENQSREGLIAAYDNIHPSIMLSEEHHHLRVKFF